MGVKSGPLADEKTKNYFGAYFRFIFAELCCNLSAIDKKLRGVGAEGVDGAPCEPPTIGRATAWVPLN